MELRGVVLSTVGVGAKKMGRRGYSASPHLSLVPERLRRSFCRVPLRWAADLCGRSPDRLRFVAVLLPERFRDYAFGGAFDLPLSAGALSCNELQKISSTQNAGQSSA